MNTAHPSLSLPEGERNKASNTRNSPPSGEHEGVIVLFDGICNFCNSWINFIIRHDTKKKFRFAALQSDIGKRLLTQYNISEKHESVVLIFNGKAHIKATACFHICYHLGGIYSLMFAFVIIPAYISDFYYDIIARHRYKWWGKKDSCMIPTEDLRE